MKAYAIFDGGGVLGAALAGCFAAAQEQDIEFVGFGGTSAGSIVALLGSVGYLGPEMEEFLVETNFTDFLNESGRPVDELKSKVRSILADLETDKWGKTLRAGFALIRLVNLVKGFSSNLGVDNGETLKKVLLAKIIEKKKTLKDHANITFQDL